jgi:transcriptional regulator with XRE-family HTH domain
VTQPPLLIHELERLARERGWTIAQLASQLGVSPKSFYNLRLGHSTVSLDVLSRVAVLFGESRTMRELVLHYLRVEYPALGRAGRAHAATRAAALAVLASHTRWRVASWVAQVPLGEGARKGLYLQSGSAVALSATARFIQRELERLRCSVVVLNANARISRSHAEAAEAATVLIVERVEHASDAVAALILRRHEAQRLTVVTTSVDREQLQDRHLVLVARAAMQQLSLDLVRPPADSSGSASPSSSTLAHVDAT